MESRNYLRVRRVGKALGGGAQREIECFISEWKPDTKLGLKASATLSASL